MEKHFKSLLDKKVEYKEVEGYNFGEIKAITYDSIELNGKKTKAFAYIGFPDTTEKVPAVVLAHGGGGVAFAEWVKMWNDRGYAAIAMSNTGDFPEIPNTWDFPEESGDHKKHWHHGLFGIFEEEGYTDAPNYDGMKDWKKPVEEQWMYHAVSQTILAGNILRDDPRVDSSKIGITGVSWGGVITSLTIGYDNRFAFAIPIYGSGYLAQSMGRLGDLFRMGTNPKNWLAECNFDKANMPVLWLCWNADSSFSLNSNSLSYIDTIKNNPETRISAIHELLHAHYCGWPREESYTFADSVCKGTKRLPSVGVDSTEIINPDNVKILGIKIYYIKNPMTYVVIDEKYQMTEKWKTMESINRLPKNAEYYIEITSEINGIKHITTSELRKIQ